MVSVQKLLVEVERLQHRAVVLEQLADEAARLFEAGLGESPKFLIGVENGMAVRARWEVIFTIQCELRRAAELARGQLLERLDMKMSAPPEEATAVITEGVPQPEYFPDENGKEELSTLRATLMPNVPVEMRDRLR